jgi:outer membrane protein assembly factor BamE (lipoprotein component of BamABCDE complex)
MGTKCGTARTGIRRIATVVAMLAITACAPLTRNHGYVPTEADLAGITVGVDTRETVTRDIGSPTALGVLDPAGFYYVASRFERVAFLEPREVDRTVVAITFNPAGTVRNVERYGLEDGRVVALSRRVTDDNIRDTTFIRQLMGNIGRFDAEQILGSD